MVDNPHMSRIFNSDIDSAGSCPFYYKIGACRHGDQCSRHHNRPTSSQTLLLAHIYPGTAEAWHIAQEEDFSDEQYAKAQNDLEEFYDELFTEMAAFGEVEDMVVVDNVSEHMWGNVYVKFFREEDAERALQRLANKYYAGKLIKAEFSPVSDFREARCRAFHESRCNRGGFCNFMHIKHIPRANKLRLIKEMYEEYPEYNCRDWSGVKREIKKRRKMRKAIANGESIDVENQNPNVMSGAMYGYGESPDKMPNSNVMKTETEGSPLGGKGWGGLSHHPGFFGGKMGKFGKDGFAAGGPVHFAGKGLTHLAHPYGAPPPWVGGKW